jgi:hypothetical protein
MNIIFDTINDIVYAMASSGSFFEMKAIALNTAMTKKKIIKYKPNEELNITQE